ncbi:MAG: PTS sugar transporter subunit IIA [Proteobacteria bacterium]|nr:PTS sugar transporter subunit IIA [Pseudomonadota bacterium]
MQLYDYLSADGVSFDISGDNKREILEQLSEVLLKKVPIQNARTLVDQLVDREDLSTTGIGFEVAVPHCKSPEINTLQVVIGRSQNGLDFGSLDGKPVKIFFLLIAPEQSSSEHLKALAKIARLSKNDTIRKGLLDCKTALEIVEYIRDHEDSCA